MENREYTKAVLNAMRIGTWIIELEEGKPNRLYGDDVMLMLLGAPKGLSPEELYAFWEKRIDPTDVKAGEAYIEKMKNTGSAEIEYKWNHPSKGTTFIRCTGMRDYSAEGKIQLCGAHRDITILSKIDPSSSSLANYSDIANTLSKNYNSIYYVNIKDNSYLEFHCEGDYSKLDINTTGSQFFEESKMNLLTVAHPDDLEKISKYIDKQNILNRLNSGETPTCEYRLMIEGEPIYFRIKTIPVPGDPEHIVVGVENVDAEVKQKIEEQSANDKIKQIIERFTDSYQSVYVVNPRDNTFSVISGKKKIKNRYSSNFKFQSTFQLYVDHNVYELDKELVRKSTDIRYIIDRLSQENQFTIEYRDISLGKPLWYEMRIVRLKNDDFEFIMGFSNKNDEIIANKISKNIFDDYATAYMLDLRNDIVTIVKTKSKELENDPDITFATLFTAISLELDASLANFWVNLSSQEKLIEYLAGADRKEIVCKSEDSKIWKRADFTVIERNDGEPVTVLLTFKILDDEAAEKEQLHTRVNEQKKALEQNLGIIEGLASEYSGVYFLNLETEEITPYTLNSTTEANLRNAFSGALKYSDGLRLYCDIGVATVDRSRMANVGSLKSIKEELSKNKTLQFIYLNNKDEYCELKVVKVGDSKNPKYATIGFANRNEALRKEMESAAIINSLSADFSFIYIVNPITGAERTYRSDPKITAVVPTLNKISSYDERIRALVKFVLHPEDESEFVKSTKIANVMSELASKQDYSINFRMMFRGISQYWQIKYSLIDTGEKQLVVGLRNIDLQMRNEMKEKDTLKKNLQIIDVLASAYSSVYYIDLKTDELTPYSMNEDTENAFGRVFRSGIKFTDALKIYVNKNIYDADKKAVLDAGSINNIKKQLNNKKSFTQTYRSYVDGQLKFFEMYFVKVDKDNEKPTAVALGFAERDEEIVRKFVDKRLMEDYESIYLVDFESDMFRAVLSPKHLASFNDTSGRFSEIIAKYAQLVDSESGAIFNKFTDINFLRNVFLRSDDRRELIYKAPSLEKPWRRAIANVVERKNGIPTSAIVSFVALDSKMAETFELNETIKRQKTELEKQSAELEIALSKAEAANKAKTSFLSNMSHDIRTPMNAIIGFTNLALANPEDVEKVKGYLQKTAVSSQHLLSLINDILDMSRIESGKIQLEESECSLAEIMHDLTTIILGQAQAKQQHMFIDAVNIMNENVICDKLRLHQVLINIIGNAIKFTPVGGDIHLFLQQTAFDNGKATYEFHVKDSGIGMSKEFAQKIFEPFEREFTSTISRTQGTGLGMAITKNIVDLMGGDIKVESEQGHGTEFTVTLTFKVSKGLNNLKPLVGLEGKRGLIVDDDFNSCDGAKDVLKQLKINQEWSMHAKEALLRAEQAIKDGNPYSLFIVDYLMPEISGLDFVKKLRSIVGPEPIVMIVTAYDWQSIQEEGLAAGVSGFLTKPIFVSTVHTFLSKQLGLFDQEEKFVEVVDQNFEGKKILLVEDNELNREIAKEILEENGFVIDTAEDGLIAVNKVKASKPGAYDVILMDVQMPNMDGYEATRNIRQLKNKALANIPIIAMTANAFEEDKKCAFEAGMNDHVAKPIDVEKLKEALKKFLK